MQVFRPLDGSPALIGVVGPLQLDVLRDRLATEYGLPVEFDQSEFQLARWLSAADRKKRDDFVEANRSGIAEDLDGDLVYLARSQFYLDYTARARARNGISGREGCEGGKAGVGAAKPRNRRERWLDLRVPRYVPSRECGFETTPILWCALPAGNVRGRGAIALRRWPSASAPTRICKMCLRRSRHPAAPAAERHRGIACAAYLPDLASPAPPDLPRALLPRERLKLIRGGRG